MKNAKLLLKQLTKDIPPGQGQRHNLTIDEGGNLVIHLMLGKRYQPIALTEKDLDLTVDELAKEVYQYVRH